MWVHEGLRGGEEKRLNTLAEMNEIYVEQTYYLKKTDVGVIDDRCFGKYIYFLELSYIHFSLTLVCK